MRTTGIITESVYRSLVEFRVKKKRGQISPKPITDQAANRLHYIILLFPVGFFCIASLVFHLRFLVAAPIALFWFVSFFIAGLLYHRMIVGVATRRPNLPDLDKPRDYSIEDNWLVIRTSDTENRVALSRAVALVVTPTVSFLDCGDLGPVALPFGSASDRP